MSTLVREPPDDIHPARLEVHLRNMMWSTTRGLRRGRVANAADTDDIVSVLLHGCLVGGAMT